MYENDIRALAIIPAKTDSTRLKKKNLRVIAGKTLVEHALDYATNSELIKMPHQLLPGWLILPWKLLQALQILEH